MADSPSPLPPEAWCYALRYYPGDLPTVLSNILIFGAQLGHPGFDVCQVFENLKTANEDPSIIQKQLDNDLALGRVSPNENPYKIFSSPLGLVLKPDRGWRRIHHLSHPRGNSVNDWISPEDATLQYTAVTEIFELIRRAGRGAYMIKKDLKDAFRMIPVAPHHRYLLGFTWQGKQYHENCLPFGLRTAPFLFNLFVEGLHWILQSYLRWQYLAHYLDDFIHVIPPQDGDVNKKSTLR